MLHFGGRAQSNVYYVNLFLPNKVLIAGVRVTESNQFVGSFDVIVGMDIITRGDFSITNESGKTFMSYRFPSIRGIDYVIDANRARFAGVNPNDPCPCGKLDDNGTPLRFRDCHMIGLERRSA